jgi:L-methionine (R)-S-oxide reductase
MINERNHVVQTWLEDFVRDHGGAAGSVHLHEDGGLRLAASVNLPPKVQEIVAWVPSGKGMAGLALERGEPVQTCNLRRDAGSGGVMPGAKAVNAQAAIAMPVRDSGGFIIAVAGVAFADEREIAGDEIDRLEKAASSLAAIAFSKSG